jgi:hypothetical protein
MHYLLGYVKYNNAKQWGAGEHRLPAGGKKKGARKIPAPFPERH